MSNSIIQSSFVKAILCLVCCILVQCVSKKTEFCQIDHLEILLVIGEKYLRTLWHIQSDHALSRQFQCFYWALGRYSLGGKQGLERGTKEQEFAQKQMIFQHNSNWNQSHYSRLDWFNWIFHEKLQVFLPNC